MRDLKAHEVRANARLDDLKAAQADLATARREVAELQDALAGDIDTEAAHRAAEIVPGGPVGGPDPEVPAVGSSLDRDALSALVARAAEAAALLSSSLAEAAELVRPDGDEVVEVVVVEPVPHPEPAPEPTPRRERPRRREPVAIPVGVFDDTPEAVARTSCGRRARPSPSTATTSRSPVGPPSPCRPSAVG